MKPVLALLIRLLSAAALVLPAFRASAGVVFTTLHSFHVSPNGPIANELAQGRDGNFYGTTQQGGTNGGYGTVFKISTNGALSILHSFTGGNDGGNPAAGLVQASDGSFYGTTSGGTNGLGTVFKITTAGALTTLYSFTGGDDGAAPSGRMVLAGDGSFYGTTQGGGLYRTNQPLPFPLRPQQPTVSSFGTVFKISTNGALRTIYLFGTLTNEYGAPLDGESPSGLTQGSDGNLYGATYDTIFQLSLDGVLTPMVSGISSSALVQGNDGFFYGTTLDGGTQNRGSVFKMSTNGVLVTLYSFKDDGEGSNPQGGLVQGIDGNFYGTTEVNGFGSSGTPGGGYTIGYGTVFKVSTNGALTTLYSFTGGAEGSYPLTALVQGSDGNLYGATQGGDSSPDSAFEPGTVFKVSTNGALTTLYSFGLNDGASPSGGLVQGNDGCFYGTTAQGGTDGIGTVFKVSTNGEVTILYSFGLHDGSPVCLVQGSDGYLYGTTGQGGAYGQGTVFRISTNGVLTSLYSFTGRQDGFYPYGLTQGNGGYLYGATSSGSAGEFGTVFRISPSGALTTLCSFTGGNKGFYPNGLAQGGDGFLYGTIVGNGAHGCGSVFKISSTGALTTLYSFTGGDDGSDPECLVQGIDGNFYGTTYDGGTYADGTVFKITGIPQRS